MAIIKVINNPIDSDNLLHNVCEYIVKGSKTRNGFYVGTRGLSVEDPYTDIILMRELYRANGGRRGYHITVSFDKDCSFTFYDAYKMAYTISGFFFPEYQVLFGVHTDEEHVHIHFFINSVSLITGKKLHFDYELLYGFKVFVQKVEMDYYSDI